MFDKKEKFIFEQRKKWANIRLVKNFREHLLRFGKPDSRMFLASDGSLQRILPTINLNKVHKCTHSKNPP